MITSDLNLNYLKIFMWVYQKRSMTAAARELHLTQSGVSQHIKSLEESLGVELFDRIHRKLIPNPVADQLYEDCTRTFSELERSLENIQPQAQKTLKGSIHIGLPTEFGANVVIPLLSAFGNENPEVRFDIRFGLPQEIAQLVLDGELDFALIDHFSADPRLAIEEIYRETLSLCISPKLLKEVGNPRNKLDDFLSLPYISYQSGEPILKMWFEHHFGRSRVNLKTRAIGVNVRGVARFVLNGLGAGILPNHLLERIKGENYEFKVLKASGSPLENDISVVYLRDRSLAPSAQAAIHFLKENL